MQVLLDDESPVAASHVLRYAHIVHTSEPHFSDEIWLAGPLRALAAAVAAAQGGGTLALHVCRDECAAGRLLRCFDDLVVPRPAPLIMANPDAGGGGGSSRVAGAPSERAAMVRLQPHLLRAMRLVNKPAGACIRRVLLYTRGDASRRQWRGAARTARVLDAAGFDVTLLEHMPATPAAAAALFNAADALVTPHGAAVYNAIYMHDAAVVLELGEHFSWWAAPGGMAGVWPSGALHARITAGIDVRFADRAAGGGDPPFSLRPEAEAEILARLQARACEDLPRRPAVAA